MKLTFGAPDIALRAFRHSRHATIIIAPDPPRWTILQINDAYLAVTRQLGDNLMGCPLFEAFPESAAVELEAQAEELQATAAQLEERTEAAEIARRDAEAAERQLHTVFAQAPAAVGVTAAPDHRFVLANRGYEVLVGRKVRTGQTFREALPEIALRGTKRSSIASTARANRTWRARRRPESRSEKVCWKKAGTISSTSHWWMAREG